MSGDSLNPPETSWQNSDEAAPRKANGNGGTQHRFKIVDFDQIVLGTQRDYIVRGVIPIDATVIVWGPPKCGKSFWTYDLTMCIAQGIPYRGKRVQQGRVLYIAMEGDAGLVKRTEAYRSKFLGDEQTHTPFHLITTKLNLPLDVGDLIFDIEAHAKGDYAVIVLDTLNRSIGGSENKDEDMGRYIEAVDRLRLKFKCTIIVIHHSGNDANKPRGHTSLSGAADASIKVTNDAGKHLATVEFMKDGESGEELPFGLEVVNLEPDQDGEERTSCVVIHGGEADAPSRTKSKGGRPRTDRYDRAMTKLHDLMVDIGKPLPINKNCPTNTNGVPYDDFTRLCMASGVVSPAAANPTADWKRIFDSLCADGKIAIWNNIVWPTAKMAPDSKTSYANSGSD